MTVNYEDRADAHAPMSFMTRIWDNSVWGADAQERWRELMTQGPAIWPQEKLVVTTSPQAVHDSLHDASVFSSNPSAAYFGSDTGAIPLQIDPPEHSRYRKLLDPLFTPKKMAAREPEVAELVNRFIDTFIERGSVNFSHEFAIPFPSAMFLRLMGLPFDELTDFLQAKETMIRPPGNTEDERTQNVGKAAMWISDYINTAMAQREKNMTDDILGYFLTLERQGTLTREEILNICILFIPAGLDTVTDTLECSFAFLGRHPEHRRQLVEDQDLIPKAIEEILRYETPVPIVTRIAMSDASIDGCPVMAGTRVRAMLSIANHDPLAFGNPEVMDFHRERNPHIAFGAGVHRCVGSHLARLELRVALREWHRRIPDYEIPEGTVLQYRPGLREIEDIPLLFPAGVRELS